MRQNRTRSRREGKSPGGADASYSDVLRRYTATANLRGRETGHPVSSHGALRLLTDDGDGSATAQQGRRLAELAGAMDAPCSFHKGQFVRWKAGLRNRTLPAYHEIAIVREVLESPVFDGCEQARCCGSPDFGEPLTLVLAALDGDGNFLELRYDGRRFEPAEGKG